MDKSTAVYVANSICRGSLGDMPLTALTELLEALGYNLRAHYPIMSPSGVRRLVCAERASVSWPCKEYTELDRLLTGVASQVNTASWMRNVKDPD